MRISDISAISHENRVVMELRDLFRNDLIVRPELRWPWHPFCKTRLLIVTDGGLDFSMDDFGLAVFVRTLLDSVIPTRFEITLGHLDNRSGSSMMDFDDRIKDRKANFKFDDNDDFRPDMYDVVFLFGIRASKSGRGTAADGSTYPTSRLADTELQALTEFQNGGGGLFATGDHGALGRFMGQSLARAGKMRLWESTSGNPDLDEVSMGGPRRNDTNRPGDPGSQFNDQSDDIPQVITPRMYSVTNGIFRYSFPHPLLCGPNGVISVMPDHPHEGECVEPSDTNDDLNFKSPLGPEFPNATDGGLRPLPEVISTNSVLWGTTSGIKQPTIGHTFGGICAYDGHRADIGRVVTDATWHHFVNINLIGVVRLPDNTVKGQGFLASPAGQQHLADIRAYFRNLAIWLARPSNLRCMNSGWLVFLQRQGRVMEAVLTRTDLKTERLGILNFWEIGRHARDVLGDFAGRCQSRRLILDLIIPERLELIPRIDPWIRFKEQEVEGGGDGDSINWINGDHMLDVALGAAIAAINSEFDDDSEERIDAEAVEKVARQGANKGLDQAIEALGVAARSASRFADR